MNGESVGTNGADGTLDVTLPADAEEVELEVTTDAGGEGEWEHEFEDDEAADETDDGDDEGWRSRGSFSRRAIAQRRTRRRARGFRQRASITKPVRPRRRRLPVAD